METRDTILAMIAYTLIADELGISGVYSELIFIFFSLSLLIFIFVGVISEIVDEVS
ncbi:MULTISPECIES: hypothetical protein [Natrinema]|uniref:hypothetical protein n=1 Tax=Natrinema TaxID=88723 RepID=UPI0012DF6355|nr:MULTISPECIES: hypothetical protein [Natrinema]